MRIHVGARVIHAGRIKHDYLENENTLNANSLERIIILVLWFKYWIKTQIDKRRYEIAETLWVTIHYPN